MKKYRILILKDGFYQDIHVQCSYKNIFGNIKWRYIKTYNFDYSTNKNFHSIEHAKEYIDKAIIPKTTEIINYP